MGTVYYQSIRDSSDSEDFTEPSKAEGVTLVMDEGVQLLPNEHPIPLKLRVFAFIMCGMNITSQYLYYTAPIAFLSNELIEKRGFSSSMAGAVFGSYSLSITITMVFSQKWSRIISCKNALLLSILVFALSTPGFYFNLSNSYFIVYLFLSRMAQGVVVGICDIQLMGAMSLMFPNRLSLVSSVYELTFSMALMIGPSLGGYLYQLQGFWLPMNVLTGMYVPVALIGVLAMSNIPPGEAQYEDTNMRQMMILPVLVLGVFTMMTLSIVATFIEAFFANYVLIIYDRTEEVSGLIITMAGVLYTCSTAFSGFLGEKYKAGSWMIILGLLMMWVCTMMTDPSELGVKRKGLWWPALMYGLFEVGSGFVQVSLLPVIIIHYQNHSKVPENVATCHMSGIYSSMFFLGSFLGPILGGILLSYTSYSWAFIISGFLFVINIVVVIGIYCNDRTFLSPVVQDEKSMPYEL